MILGICQLSIFNMLNNDSAFKICTVTSHEVPCVSVGQQFEPNHRRCRLEIWIAFLGD